MIMVSHSFVMVAVSIMAWQMKKALVAFGQPQAEGFFLHDDLRFLRYDDLRSLSKSSSGAAMNDGLRPAGHRDS